MCEKETEVEQNEDVDDELDEYNSLLFGIRTVNRMEAQYDHKVAKRFRLLHALSLVFGALLIVLLFVWIVNYMNGFGWQSNPSIQFNWHPLLMIFGMVILYSQSILAYRIGRQYRKRVLKLWHTCVHGSVFLLSVIGLKAVFDSHNLAKPPIPNMYSLHSWLGLGTVLLFCFQFIAGFVSFLYPGLPLQIRTAYMHVHTTFGTFGFVLAIITSALGLYEKTFFELKLNYSKMGSEAILINIIGLVLIIFGALVLYLVNENTYKRVPLPEDDHVPLASTQAEATD